jgi:hypothetical protein
MSAVTTPAADFEFQRLTLPRDVDRRAAQRLLAQAAEYEGWELARVRLYPDGTRRVVLRRRIIRQVRPAAPAQRLR